MRIDLNADLGEGVTDDDGLLGVVTSANLACGFHAGDEDTMRRVCAGAAERGVVVGAQVSYRDRGGLNNASSFIGLASAKGNGVVVLMNRGDLNLWDAGYAILLRLSEAEARRP